ncbi:MULTISPECIES: Nramp family divalent metal transporter [Lactiplantibacillus]|jgi:NRAMP (natural resistance-associated macrophage protein)-like metal ion transporter|uniref:Divalent metal cation transporter MntH n=1 Tax=Lactiplantibacillus pentosus TaxID=1589 RepID=A0ABD7IMY0_LACPE|nr:MULTISPECIES: Nramp family divalent metal transporter [Lactiplantibacillus]MCA1342297.1 Nramp family divalent metal transporter [Lactiplantibacillus pentosus]MCC3164000.1 Nramp family divalent metal transporter [Lactiplantibacillus pentosus]MCJ8184832.1 Nramp family divalent metal transporter [Lactiplantibacillus pentosus]MCJ8189009.1 Nramp family divalent metal transporter [Lactiplantibacillus pentosus]MCM8608096.1 Nramp family divalent metal transporter [Lactiplantibacillus sp. B652]
MQPRSHQSLEEINQSVAVPDVHQTAFWRKFLAYSGPGALVAVGYMDPGNWLTSLAGGGQFQYRLLTVLALAIIVAMFMQALAIKLGVVARQDLAQAIAAKLPRPIRYALWILNEVAMMATDMTGVIGTAIALKLLFGLPLLAGILLTIADVLVVLLFLRFGIRRVEFLVLAAIISVGIIFGLEVGRAHVQVGQVMLGLVPNSLIIKNHTALVLSLGILGATIMPHNLYLHSSLAQSRRYDYHDPLQVNEALRFANWDSTVHLIAAFLINALLLVLGGTLFFGHTTALASLQAVFNGLKNPAIVGALASPFMSWLFALALLITGLISSITSTLAGQIVMEGYLHIRLPLWQRRLLTRAVTLIPILIIGFMVGFSDAAFENLIIYAQVALSVALPFTLLPLVALTNNRQLMGSHVNRPAVTWLGYGLAGIITILNVYLVYSLF